MLSDMQKAIQGSGAESGIAHASADTQSPSLNTEIRCSPILFVFASIYKSQTFFMSIQ